MSDEIEATGKSLVDCVTGEAIPLEVAYATEIDRVRALGCVIAVLVAELRELRAAAERLSA